MSFSQGRTILAIDDDPQNLRLVTAVLAHEGYKVESASSGEAGLAKIERCSPHLVLLDINMPGLSGLDVMKCLRLRNEYVSVIFVTANSSTEDIIRGLDAGADDYVCKPFNPHELLARVRAQLRIKDLNDRLAVANRRLQELVDIDDLTGLYNMRSVYQRLEIELQRGRRYGRPVGVVMMDADNFKSVNDGNDHLFGSFVLSKIGQLIRENIRQVDFAARYGGDEFLLCLTETGFEGAVRFAERLRKKIESQNFSNGESQIRLTASFGVALSDPLRGPVDARTLVRAADSALYEAKRTGKNCVRFVDPQMPPSALPTMDVG